jgi:hypothetical protein
MPDPNSGGAERSARDTALTEKLLKARSLLPKIPHERIARPADEMQDHDQVPPQPAAPFAPLPAPIRMSPIEA